MNIKAVLTKDIRSEFRTRYALSALSLFVFTTVILVYFTVSGKEIEAKLLSAVYWIVVFFASMTGLARSFVQEEERGTILYLKLNSDPASVFFGKLIFNILIMLLINIISLILFSVFIQGFNPTELWIFFTNILITGISLASGTTILSAIISKSGNKNTLLPILAFPVLLPGLILGSDVMADCLSPALKPNTDDLLVIFGYSGALITASYLLFDYVWKE